MDSVGAILVARQMLDSDIWTSKPAWWLKVWMFMMLKVNHSPAGRFQRGQYLFTRDSIHRGCNLQHDGIKPETVDNVLRFLKTEGMLTTQKTTRGFIATIVNYDTYQTLSHYRNETENKEPTRQKRDRNETETILYEKNANNAKHANNGKEKSIPLPVAPTVVPEYSGYHADTLGFVKWWQEEKHAVVSAKWIEHVETVFAGSKVPLDFAEKAAKDFEGTKKPWLIAEELIKAWREETKYDEAW